MNHVKVRSNGLEPMDLDVLRQENDNTDANVKNNIRDIPKGKRDGRPTIDNATEHPRNVHHAREKLPKNIGAELLSDFEVYS